MLGAYGWAFTKPIRKLYYNLTITFVSVRRRAARRRHRGARPDRPALRAARRVLGCRRRAERQLRHHRLSDRRRVRRELGRVGAGVSAQAVRRARGLARADQSSRWSRAGGRRRRRAGARCLRVAALPDATTNSAATSDVHGRRSVVMAGAMRRHARTAPARRPTPGPAAERFDTARAQSRSPTASDEALG